MNISRSSFVSLWARLAAPLLVAPTVAAALATMGCSSNTDTDDSLPSIRFGTLATEDSLPMWVAESEGLFAQAGLRCDIETFSAASELIAAISAAQVDIAMTDPMVTAALYASGTDVAIVWVTLGEDASQGRFGIMSARDDISSLADLAGEPIGVGSNTILEYVMDTLMLEAGIAEEDIVKSELQKLAVRYEAMASGQVAAAALPGSLLALGEAAGFTLLADDTQGENISQSVMIVRQDFLNDEAGASALALARDVWDKAVAFINEDPSSQRELLADKALLSDEIAQTYPVNTYPLAALPSQDMIDKVLEWMKHKDYLAQDIVYDAASGLFSGRS